MALKPLSADAPPLTIARLPSGRAAITECYGVRFPPQTRKESRRWQAMETRVRRLLVQHDVKWNQFLGPHGRGRLVIKLADVVPLEDARRTVINCGSELQSTDDEKVVRKHFRQGVVTLWLGEDLLPDAYIVKTTKELEMVMSAWVDLRDLASPDGIRIPFTTRPLPQKYKWLEKVQTHFCEIFGSGRWQLGAMWRVLGTLGNGSVSVRDYPNAMTVMTLEEGLQKGKRVIDIPTYLLTSKELSLQVALGNRLGYATEISSDWAFHAVMLEVPYPKKWGDDEDESTWPAATKPWFRQRTMAVTIPTNDAMILSRGWTSHETLFAAFKHAVSVTPLSAVSLFSAILQRPTTVRVTAISPAIASTIGWRVGAQAMMSRPSILYASASKGIGKSSIIRDITGRDGMVLDSDTIGRILALGKYDDYDDETAIDAMCLKYMQMTVEAREALTSKFEVMAYDGCNMNGVTSVDAVNPGNPRTHRAILWFKDGYDATFRTQAKPNRILMTCLRLFNTRKDVFDDRGVPGGAKAAWVIFFIHAYPEMYEMMSGTTIRIDPVSDPLIGIMLRTRSGVGSDFPTQAVLHHAYNLLDPPGTPRLPRGVFAKMILDDPRYVAA